MKDTIPFSPECPDPAPREFTWRAVMLGLALSAVMCAANAYLGLYAGMTVSASIPAAVISMAILRGLMRTGTILENNIVQTMASAGESLAAGIVFTVPALIITGVWSDFKFLETTLIALTGGILGIIFMIPLRKVLIVREKDLTYPEGVACAEVLQAGESGGAGFRAILYGIAAGGIMKLLTSGLQVVRATIEHAFLVGRKVLYAGSDTSLALVAVGYIVNLEVAAQIFLGGFFAWNIVMPFLDPGAAGSSPPLDLAWTLWKTRIRYLGVGTMITGGVWSIFSVRRGIAGGLSGLFPGSRTGSSETVRRCDRDLQPGRMGIILVLTVLGVLVLYNRIIPRFGMSLMTTGIMVVSAFFFVAVSSYIVGLVGSSNNPVSGMTICVLLGTSAILLVFGMQGGSAILATLGVAGVVCCAACSAGDISQDLKTGYLVGATPRNQQIAQILGILLPALIIAPILTLLHHAYTIGSDKLLAPQATLFASIVQGIFGKGDLPRNMVYGGILLGIVIILVDLALKAAKSSFRLHIMPVAVGIYLPVTLAVPILAGGIIRRLVDSRRKTGQASNSGILLASGLIAGESIMGIILAALIALHIDIALHF